MCSIVKSDDRKKKLFIRFYFNYNPTINRYFEKWKRWKYVEWSVLNNKLIQRFSRHNISSIDTGRYGEYFNRFRFSKYTFVVVLWLKQNRMNNFCDHCLFFSHQKTYCKKWWNILILNISTDWVLLLFSTKYFLILENLEKKTNCWNYYIFYDEI